MNYEIFVPTFVILIFIFVCGYFAYIGNLVVVVFGLTVMFSMNLIFLISSEYRINKRIKTFQEKSLEIMKSVKEIEKK